MLEELDVFTTSPTQDGLELGLLRSVKERARELVLCSNLDARFAQVDRDLYSALARSILDADRVALRSQG